MAGISRTANVTAFLGDKARLPSLRTIKRAALGGAMAAGIAATGYYGHQFWTIGRYLESTDDAYVKADYTTIAPKVPGYIADVLVRDNESVRRGQVLARIDDRDYRAALDQARADVAAAEAAIRNLDAQIQLQQSIVDQQKASIAATEATLQYAREDHARYADLMKTGAGTIQRAQQAESILREKTAQRQRDQAGLVAAQRQIDVLVSERGKAMAQRDRSRAAERQAELNLSYTVIVAPVDGTVGARSLRVGQYVLAGTQLMAVVPLHAVYVVANFKETQLTHVRGGQRVTIAIDGFPDATLTGHVDSLSPASGLEFALLPPDNATGNFTKIVQRIPVKIVLDDSDLAGLLRAGMSVVPTIDTKEAALAARGAPSGTTPPANPAPGPAADHRLSENPARHPATGS
ncbi:HlyD family secretion protein [Vineibacter terrae]|uniref:HlyD family secretion protein n=1 Tax=Vineibacter terrae TaxID=2586908 RepID=UPI002E2EC355|nr:HlyD family secretion protein [Vineibacter terrae]HEX2885609.1 HlyD family secretion protein [Vineibacter terrae]